MQPKFASTNERIQKQLIFDPDPKNIYFIAALTQIQHCLCNSQMNNMLTARNFIFTNFVHGSFEMRRNNLNNNFSLLYVCHHMHEYEELQVYEELMK